MKRLVTLVLIAAGSLGFAGGCSSVLAPRPDPTKFYVLTPIAQTAAAPAPAGAHPLAIGLGPVQFPDYLSHLEMVTRVGSNQVELSPTDRWAAPLDESFRRMLARNLATLLGTDQIVAFPWYAATEAKLDYRVEVTVERFERDAGGVAELEASWRIRSGRSDRALVSRQSNLRAGAGSTSMDAAVAGLSTDLNDLSKQIADAIIELNSTRPQN